MINTYISDDPCKMKLYSIHISQACGKTKTTIFMTKIKWTKKYYFSYPCCIVQSLDESCRSFILMKFMFDFCLTYYILTIYWLYWLIPFHTCRAAEWWRWWSRGPAAGWTGDSRDCGWRKWSIRRWCWWWGERRWDYWELSSSSAVLQAKY